MRNYLYPAQDLFPGPTLFPADDTISPGYQQSAEVAIGSLIITSDQPNGVSFIMDTLDGWLGSSGSSLTVAQKLAAPGAWPSPREMTARTITVAGGIVAPTAALRAAAEDALNAACSLDATLFVVTEDLVTRWCIVYRQGEVAITKDTDVSSTFSVTFTAPDPRKFAFALPAGTRLPSVSGGLTFPVTFPVVFDATIVTGECETVNVGNCVGPMTARITGPCAGPVITHVETGLVLAFDPAFELQAGEWLDIDMEGRTVLANGTAARNAQIVTRGFCPFIPGVNTCAFSAASGDVDAKLEVWGTPAWQ